MTDHCPTCGAAVRVEASGVTHYMVPIDAERMSELEAKVESLTAGLEAAKQFDAMVVDERIRELEALVESAYREGFIDGYDDDARPQHVNSRWKYSDVRKQLEKAR